MKTNIRLAVMFILGLAIGGLGAKQFFKKKYEELLVDEIADLREYYKDKNMDLEVEYRRQLNLIVNEFDNGDVLPVEAAEKIESFVKDLNSENPQTAQKMIRDYNSISKKKDLTEVLIERGVVPFDDHPHDDEVEEDEDEEEDEEDTDEYVEQAEEPDNEISVYVINANAFNNEKENYEKITLVYFAEDGVLTDDRDKPIYFPEKIISADALTSFGKIPGQDPNVVYVRNTRNSCDFEICRNPGGYTETVFGVKPVQVPKRKPTALPKEEAPEKKITKPRAKKAVQDGKTN